MSGPIKRLLAERVEPVGKAADRAILHQDAGDAAIADKAGERDRERRQADLGDPEGVVEPGENARAERDDDGERHRRALMERPGHDAGRETHDRGDGKIDFAADDDQRHRQRDDALLDRQLEQIDEISDAQESTGSRRC